MVPQTVRMSAGAVGAEAELGPPRDTKYMKIKEGTPESMAICEKHGNDWIDCILSQMQYRLGRIGDDRQTFLFSDGRGYKVFMYENKEQKDTARTKVLEKVSNWLKRDVNQMLKYSNPCRAKGRNANLTDSRVKAEVTVSSVEEFCQSQYSMTINKYADMIANLGKKPLPVDSSFDFELASFAFSRVYDETRLSLLREDQANTKYWSIWDYKAGKVDQKVHLTLGGLL